MKYKLYSILEKANENLLEVDIYDSTTINWNDFLWSNGYYVHTLTKAEILKPYLLSYQYYGNSIYEDIILLLNEIEDIWNIPVGTEIKIPKIQDLKTFIFSKRI